MYIYSLPGGQAQLVAKIHRSVLPKYSQLRSGTVEWASVIRNSVKGKADSTHLTQAKNLEL